MTSNLVDPWKNRCAGELYYIAARKLKAVGTRKPFVIVTKTCLLLLLLVLLLLLILCNSCHSYILCDIFSIFLLMPYCEQDLASLLDNMQKPFTEAQVGSSVSLASLRMMLH